MESIVADYITNEAISAYKQRDEILLELGYGSYREYLGSQLWGMIRDDVMTFRGRSGFSQRKRCEICNRREANQVHHNQYTLDNLSGDTLEGLIAVCNQCHSFGEVAHTVSNEAVATVKVSPEEATRRAEYHHDRRNNEFQHNLDGPVRRKQCKECFSIWLKNKYAKYARTKRSLGQRPIAYKQYKKNSKKKENRPPEHVFFLARLDEKLCESHRSLRNQRVK